MFCCRTPKETFDPAEFTASYKENLPNENLVLQFAENFRRQYVHLYRDRKPLLLNPVNECFVEVSLFCYRQLKNKIKIKVLHYVPFVVIGNNILCFSKQNKINS